MLHLQSPEVLKQIFPFRNLRLKALMGAIEL